VLHILYWVVAFLCGIIITLIGFAWEINLGVSIPSQTPVNPNNPFSTYFTFTNNSHFVLTNLHCDFVINGKDALNNTLIDCHYIIDIPGQLAQGHSDTERALFIGATKGMNANMQVNISYTPKFLFIPLPPRRDSFSFQSIETASGYWWIEQDVVK
jgi:hypothetical protein